MDQLIVQKKVTEIKKMSPEPKQYIYELNEDSAYENPDNKLFNL